LPAVAVAVQVTLRSVAVAAAQLVETQTTIQVEAAAVVHNLLAAQAVQTALRDKTVLLYKVAPAAVPAQAQAADTMVAAAVPLLVQVPPAVVQVILVV
jgi:hypothetical protein